MVKLPIIYYLLSFIYNIFIIKNSITGSQEDNAPENNKNIRTTILLMFDICLVDYICVQYYTK